MALRIEYPYMPPKELRGNSRTGWKARNQIKKVFQDNTIFRLLELDPEPMDQVSVKYIAHYCGKPIDRDNLTMGMKYALDCLVKQKIIKDDSPDVVKELITEYHRVPHKDQVKLIMEVTEI